MNCSHGFIYIYLTQSYALSFLFPKLSYSFLSVIIRKEYFKRGKGLGYEEENKYFRGRNANEYGRIERQIYPFRLSYQASAASKGKLWCLGGIPYGVSW